MAFRKLPPPALALLAVAGSITFLLSGRLTSHAVQVPTISLDMVTAGTTYDNTTNTMTVGAIDSSSTSSSNVTHTHTTHLVIKNVEDLIGWQVRLNYDGDRMRPLNQNIEPFVDNATFHSVGFANLPIDSALGTHRDTTAAANIPPAAPGPQTALIGGTYSGAQNTAISPDTPAKTVPDDNSYSAPTGGVLSQLNLQVLGGQCNTGPMFMDLDDASPNPPGSDIAVFNGVGMSTLSLTESALNDGTHTEAGDVCGTPTATPATPTPTPVPCSACTPTPTATPRPTATATATPTSTPTATPQPSPFVVNSTGDGADTDWTDGRCDDGNGICTLRAAIQQANAQPDESSILFNIAGDGTHTIRPASPLPTITSDIRIDGYSQPGARPDTNLFDLVSDAVLKIELDGSIAGANSNGLYLVDAESPNGPPTCRIAIDLHGLVINRFSADGVRLERVCGGEIQGNYIGTDPSGEIDLGNQGSGILQIDTVEDGVVSNVISWHQGYAIFAERGGGDWGIGFNLIGTNAAGTSAIGNGSGGILLSQIADVSIDRNVISGNRGPGMTLVESGEMWIRGNLIGTGSEGVAPLPNAGDGIFLTSTPSAVSFSTFSIENNVIAYNAGDGVEIVGEYSVYQNNANIRTNSIDSNGGLGIDLGGHGVTPNDRRGEDLGPKGPQKFPDIMAVNSDPTGTTIRSRLATAPDTPSPYDAYDLDFYASPACDRSSFGEGQTFLGSISVTPDQRGEARFTVTLPVAVPKGHVITATASRDGIGTSEFSRCQTVP